MNSTLSQISYETFATEIVAKVTLVLLLAGIAFIALRRASAALRHLVATLAIIFTLLAPALIRLSPEWRVALLPAAFVTPAASTVRVEANLEHQSIQTIEYPTIKTRSSRFKEVSPAAPPESVPVVSQEIPRAQLAPKATTIVQSKPAQHSAKLNWKYSLAWIWFSGFVLLAARLCFSYIRLRRISKYCERVHHNLWTQLARQVANKFEIDRPVTLLTSSEIDLPITTGIVYPKVLLPAESEEWSMERRRIVLLHEFAHIKRLDALTQLLAQIAVTIYWFHPLVWWTARQMQTQRERACDDFVLSAGAKASDYANDLLEFGSRAQHQAAYGAALAMARKSQLEGRLLAVLDKGINRKSIKRSTVAMALVIAFAIALPISAVHAIASQTSDQSATTKANPAQSGPASAAEAAQVQKQASTPSAPQTAPPSPQAPASPGSSASPVSPASAESSASSAAVSDSSTSSSKSSSKSYSYGYTTGEKLQAFECQSDGHNASFWINDNNDHHTWKANWSGTGAGGEHCQISLYAEGKIVFKPDLSGIQSITPGGFFEVSESTGPHMRKLTAKPDANGNVQLSWAVDGQTRELGEQERRALAAFLLALERQTAFSAETRVPALLKKGGPNAVLEEVGNMTGDYARSRYLLLMLENARLDNSQLLRTLEFTGKNMSSDYEHARVLLAVAKQYSLDDETSRRAFLNSSNSLKSDYEHARVLMELLKRPHLSAETRNTAIQSATNIHSDYERARVLIAATCDCNDTAATPLPAVFFETVNGVKSDYEHSRVLLSILDNKKQQLSAEDAKAILQSTTHIGSDYERRRVLTGFVERKLLSEPLVPLFLEASESIHSDNDHSTVLLSLINSGQVNASYLERLINSAGTIHSDYELSRVLTAVAAAYPLRANVRSAYIKVAQQIHSEYERNRALAAVSTSTML